MTIELAQEIFTGVEIEQVYGTYHASYKDHNLCDDDLMRLVQRLWEANA